METSTQVLIVGLGRLGGTLAAALDSRCVLQTVSAREVAGGKSVGALSPDAVVLVTTRDDCIAETVTALAASGALTASPVVLHCSGALGLEVLSAASDAGCAVGSVHPLQTFPSVQEGLAALATTPWFFEGDDRAQREAASLVEGLGGTLSVLPAGAKTRYHAAAVMCCNYMTVILDAAEQLYGSCGMTPEQSRAAMAPILETTLRNTLARGGEALTGPISRGDGETLSHHTDALADLPEMNTLYRALGEACCALANRNGQIDDATTRDLLHRLTGDSQ
ncbi:MAG: DUF2520 domain-containing protein [Phycisphaerales bacterium]|nr:DUF2520 domain-containing protein [Phycisphaerales bacterium]